MSSQSHQRLTAVVDALIEGKTVIGVPIFTRYYGIGKLKLEKGTLGQFILHDQSKTKRIRIRFETEDNIFFLPFMLAYELMFFNIKITDKSWKSYTTTTNRK